MNHSISFFRLVFTFIIAFWHFPLLSKGVLNSGYIVVEFFFILSGYLLYQSSNKQIGTIEYTKNKISRFWLKAVIITTIISLANNSMVFNHLNDFLQYSAKVFLLLVAIVPTDKNIPVHNGPIWYLTVLIWGGALIYAIIKTFPQKWKFILSVICIASYAIVLKNTYIFDEAWAYPLPLLRGLGSLSLGCIISYMVRNQRNIISNNLLNAIGILGVITSTILLFSKDVHGILPVICYSFIIFACFKKETLIYKLLNRPIFSKWASTSFEIFIGHLFVVKIVFRIMQLCFRADIIENINTIEKIIGSIIYIITLFIFGYIYQKICNKLENGLNRIF